MTTLKSRLALIESKLTPKARPTLSLGLECNDLAKLPGLVESCKRHNTPESGLFRYPIWTGAPSDEAAAMVAEVNYRPGKYQKNIRILHAENNPALQRREVKS